MFAFDFAAPVPCGGESSVDAGPGVEEVVGARAVEGVFEEVRENQFDHLLRPAEDPVDVSLDVVVPVVVVFSLNATYHVGDRAQNPRNLRVLVNEEQGIWDIVVS